MKSTARSLARSYSRIFFSKSFRLLRSFLSFIFVLMSSSSFLFVFFVFFRRLLSSEEEEEEDEYEEDEDPPVSSLSEDDEEDSEEEDSSSRRRFLFAIFVVLFLLCCSCHFRVSSSRSSKERVLTHRVREKSRFMPVFCVVYARELEDY